MTLKGKVLDVVPDATTVTFATPGVVMSKAEIVAVNWLEEINDVARGLPFHRSTESAVKPAPLTINGKLGPPAFAESGLKLLSTGGDLGAGLMVSRTALDVPPPGVELNTVMFACPAAVVSLAVTMIVNCVAEMNVVGRGKPFHLTCELALKPAPVIVSRKPGPPASTRSGLKPAILGTGLGAVSMLNGKAFDVPPPGAGLNTVTLAVPAAARSGAETIAVN